MNSLAIREIAEITTVPIGDSMTPEDSIFGSDGWKREMCDIGSKKWIQKVHIPYLHLYTRIRLQARVGSQKALRDTFNLGERVEASSVPGLVVRDLILTALARKKVESCRESESYSPSDGSASIQLQCMRYHETILNSILETWLAEPHWIGSLGWLSCDLFEYCYEKVRNLSRIRVACNFECRAPYE